MNPTDTITRPGRHRRRLSLAGLVVLGLLATLAFRGLGNWLVISDPLQPSDAIVVLGGGVPHRSIEAARLYEDQWASEIWLTRPLDPDGDDPMTRLGIRRMVSADYSRQILEAMGVPAELIRSIPNPIRNTAGEVGVISDRLSAIDGKQVIIVTSPSHTRRTRTIWRRVVGDDYGAIIRPASDDPYDARHWWRSTTDIKSVVGELMGLVNAWTGFRIGPRQTLNHKDRP